MECRRKPVGRERNRMNRYEFRGLGLTAAVVVGAMVLITVLSL